MRVRVSSRDQPEDLPFPVGELREDLRHGSRLREEGEHPAGDRLAEDRLAPRHRPDRAGQLVLLGVLEHVAAGAGAQGHPNPSIARALFLSPKTIANYVSAIFAKLQVADRAEAMIRAREAGLG